MTDIALSWSGETADLAVAANDLATDDGLETSVLISLFTDRRALDDDMLPAERGGDRRGWWGDATLPDEDDRTGSRLWLLAREKQLPAVLVRAREYAREALAWLVADSVASAVDVTAEFARPGWLALGITIHRPRKTAVTYRFDYAWAAQAARRA